MAKVSRCLIKRYKEENIFDSKERGRDNRPLLSYQLHKTGFLHIDFVPLTEERLSKKCIRI